MVFTPIAIAFELLEHLLHFLCAQEVRLAYLQGAPILLAEGFDFAGDGQGMLGIEASGNHAVIGEQAGVALLQGAECVVGEGLAAE